MDRRLIKHLLIDKGMSFADLSRTAGVGYDRLVRIVHGYRKARPEELEQIAAALGICLNEISGVESHEQPKY